MIDKIKQNLSISHLVAASVSFVLTLVTITGALFAIDDRWAKASEVKMIELRLDQKIYSDRLYDIQKRMWKLEDRYGDEKSMPPEVKEEYRKLKQEYKVLNIKLQTLYRK